MVGDLLGQPRPGVQTALCAHPLLFLSHGPRGQIPRSLPVLVVPLLPIHGWVSRNPIPTPKNKAGAISLTIKT